MYLLSIYFDEKTDKHIRNMIKQVAKKSGNTYMLDGNVPPHITIAALDTQNIDGIVKRLDQMMPEIQRGKLTWASVATFLPYVIYIAPVLNEYLQTLSMRIHENLNGLEDVKLRLNYQPFQWIPHTTIGKKMTAEELRVAFETLQNMFGMFHGEVVQIGLAKTNPYEDIKVWNLGGE